MGFWSASSHGGKILLKNNGANLYLTREGGFVFFPAQPGAPALVLDQGYRLNHRPPLLTYVPEKPIVEPANVSLLACFLSEQQAFLVHLQCWKRVTRWPPCLPARLCCGADGLARCLDPWPHPRSTSQTPQRGRIRARTQASRGRDLVAVSAEAFVSLPKVGEAVGSFDMQGSL